MALRGRRGRVSADRNEFYYEETTLLNIKWMTVKQVSVYLQISVSKVYQMAQEGRIPCCRLDQQWRFDRDEIDRWLKGRR